MSWADDIVAALSQPLRAVIDPSERIFWAFLLSSLAMPWLVLGFRRGSAALRNGLLRRAIWGDASSRADVTLVFAKALLWAVVRVPWVAATAGATLWVGLTLHDVFGPIAAPQWTPLTIAVIYSLVLFVAWDFSRFAMHWLMHRVSWLWSFHQVHHSARVLTPLTLYRTHPVETLLVDLRGMVVTAAVAGPFLYLFSGQAKAIELLGINALGFVFNLAGANLRHSHVWLRFGRVERWFIAPAQHQWHHSREPEAQMSNFGTWLALWDRLAGTWRPSPPTAPEAFGLTESNHAHDRVGSMMLAPLRDAWHALRRRGSVPPATAALVLGLWPLQARGEAALAPPSDDAAAPPTDAPDPDTPSPDAPDTDAPSPDAPDTDAPDTDAPDSDAPDPDAPDTPDSDASDSDAVSPDAPDADATSLQDPEDPEDPETPAEPTASPTSEEPPPDDAPATDAAPAPKPEAESPPKSPEPSALPDDVAPLESDEDEGTTREVVVGSMFGRDGAAWVAGSAHAITEKELERHEYDDVHKILAPVPGVYVRGEDGYGLRPNIGLRGADPNRSTKVVLLEDGLLLGPAPYSAPAAYYFPLPTRMVGVEVFKGPAAIRHGPNTIGGAINVLTRQIPDDHTSTIDIAGGRFGYVKGHGFYGTRYKGFGVLIEASRVQSSGFKDLDGGGNTGFAKNDGMIKLGYRTPEGRRVSHDVEFKGGFATENSNETYLGLTQADFDATPNRRYAATARDNMTWWRSQAELTYVVRQDDTLEFEARLYRHDFDRVWSRLNAMRGAPALTDILNSPDGGQAGVLAAVLRGEQDSVLPEHTLLIANNDRRFVSQGVQTAFRWRPKWNVVRQELEIGARLHGDAINRDHTEDAFLMTAATLVSDGSPRQDTVQNQGEALAAAFHIHDAVTLWDRLTVAPGVRVELVRTRFEDRVIDERDRNFDTALTPGVGVLVAATDWLGVFGGVHRGFSPVAPGQPAAVQPEFAVNYELGARADYNGLTAEAVGFVSDYSNLNGSCSFSAGCGDANVGDQFNAGAVLVYGLETAARYRHRFDNGFVVEAGANYTYTDSSFQDEFTSDFPQWGDVEKGFELPYVPKHLLAGTFAVGGRIWDVTASPAYNGPMRDVAGSGPIAGVERIPGFFTLDLSTEVRLLERFRLYGLLNNATNAAYVSSRRPFGIRPGAPLTFIVGVKVHVFP